MSTVPEIRKLAAVMFADIEGYTTLFQRSETVAMRQVGDHRKDLEEITAKYHGQIIQFYGDGSATVFDSVVDAIQCAIELQSTSQHHRIPIRIGIHIGDLIFKGGDIFGDVVNIASRIQNLGVSGSVLVSGKVVEELKNRPEFNVSSLGFHELKNVKTKLEVYAITGHGLVVPDIEDVSKAGKKSWTPLWLLIIVLLAAGGYYWFAVRPKPNTSKFEQGCLIIPAFKNLTGDSLDYIGSLAAAYLSKMMGGMSDVNVLSFESLNQYANADLASFSVSPILIRRTGADYSLDGSFSYKGGSKDSLLFFASIRDLHENKVLPFSIPTIICATNDPRAGIERIANVLKGYYKSKKFNFIYIPNEKAMIAYNKAVQIWADTKSEEEQKNYLLEAIREDPDFLDAYFLLLDYYNNGNEFNEEDTTIQQINSRFTDMDERAKNNLLYYEADLNGKNKDAYNYRIKEHQLSPKDLLSFTDCMIIAVEYLNDPATAIQLSNKFNIDTFDLNACYYCRSSVNMAMTAYLNSGDLDNAGKLAERLRPYAERLGQIGRLMSYYITVQDSGSIDFLIQKGVDSRDTSWSRERAEARFNLLAARIAAAHGNQQMQKHYAQLAIQNAKADTPFNLARALMLVNEWAKAEKLLLAVVKTDPDPWYFTQLGVVYAKLGNAKSANQIISKLEEFQGKYNYGEIYYYQGSIKANMGETVAALDYLKKAFNEGIKFQIGNTFQEDPNMVVLNSNKDYQALLTQYRQPQ